MSADTTWLVMPAIVALGGALMTLALDAFRKRTAAVVAAILATAVAAALAAAASTVDPQQATYGVFQLDGPYAAVTAVVYALTALILIGGLQDLARRRSGGQIAALAVLSTLGATVAITSADLVLMIMGLEVLAVTGYALVAAARTPQAAEASMKYFIQGAVATAFALVGLAVLLGTYGIDPNTFALGAALGDRAYTAGASAMMPAFAGAVLLLAAVAFKLGAVPFHAWAPDAYQSAPPVAAAVLASVPKVAAIGALGMLFVHSGFAGVMFVDISTEPLTYGWLVDSPLPRILAVLALLSIIVGNLGALRQRDLRRMLGYSGVAQVGYALVAFTALERVETGGQLAGIFPAAVVLAGTYALATAATFLGVQAIQERIPDWDGSIGALAGLVRRMPLVSAALAVAMLSLTGIPLTAGFWGKLLAFGVAVETGPLWLPIIGVIGSVVSFGYYGGVIRTLYVDDESDGDGSSSTPEGTLVASSAATMCILLALLVLAIGVIPLFTGVGPMAEVFITL